MNSLIQDLNYALRILTKMPGFTTVAILILALGIGANTAIFSLVDGVMLRTIPLQKPDRLAVFFWHAHRDPKYNSYSNYGDCGPSGGGRGCSFSVPLFRVMQGQASDFSGLAAMCGPMRFNVGGNGPASTAQAEIVSGDFFSVAGVGTILGRPLGPADDSPSASPALVLSYAYWQSAFGGERSAVGKTMRVNDLEVEIVGVTSPSFTNLAPGKTQDFFLPLSIVPSLQVPSSANASPLTDAKTWWVVMLGRLKPGVEMAQAQAQATLIFRREMLHGATPLSTAKEDPTIALQSAVDGLSGDRGDFSAMLYLLMAAAGFVLLIACANVAGLMLARSTTRQKEMAVRLALGAGRGRIIRQLLTESLLLSTAGGALGVLFAVWGVPALTALISSSSDRQFPFVVAPDWRVLAFTIGTTVLTGILFGLAPARRGTRVDLAPALKENAASLPGGGGRTRRWLHLGNALVVGQVALSIFVLIGAGLMVRTLENLKNTSPGFDTQNLLLFGIDPTLTGYKDAQITNLYRDLRQKFAALPGVRSVSYSSDALLSNSLWITEIHLDGSPSGKNVAADMLAVGPDFFSTMHIPLLAGRRFDAADFAAAAKTDAAQQAAWENAKRAAARGATSAEKALAKAPSAAAEPIPILINKEFAERYFQKEDPIGKHVGDYEGPDESPGPRPGFLIRGIVGNTKYDTLRRPVHPMMVRPAIGGGAHFELRTATNPALLIPAVRSVVNQEDANLALFQIRTQTEQIGQVLAPERIIAQLSSFFGVLALALACIGLYGLLAYEVTRQTREIGIRMAMGAQPGDVLRMVLTRGTILALVGVACGVAAALGLTRLIASLLYSVSPTDPVTFAGVAALLIIVALAACYVPARRAMKVDPMVALRYE